MSKRKRARIKRTHLQRLASDFINVTKTPNPAFMSQWAGRMYTARGPKHNKEPVQGNTFQQPVPKTKGIVNKTWQSEEGGLMRAELAPVTHAKQRKQEIKQLAMLQQSDFRQWITTFYHIVMWEHGDTVLKLFFSGDKWLFVEETGDFAKRSIFYKGRAAAERAYRYNAIRWQHVI